MDLKCAGFIATGNVVKDGRSILTKNRHLAENNQIPIFGQGTYSYWGIGDNENSFCRMGMNETGLAIGNFDPPPAKPILDEEFWQYTSNHTSSGEDGDMQAVLAECSTVEDAALWLAHHASYSCQWIIISRESNIGAIVAMDANYHSHISYIIDDWAEVGNVWYCEGMTSSRNRRILYLIGEYFNEHDIIEVRDVVRLLSRDIQSSEEGPSEPVGYTGTYPVGGLCPFTCRSGMAVVSGEDGYGGSLAMAWVAIGQTSHLCPFLPLGASYVHIPADIPLDWVENGGIEQYTDVKQQYVEQSTNVYFRDKVQEVHLYVLPVQEQMFDRYDMFYGSAQQSGSVPAAIQKMKVYADTTFIDGLQAYIDGNSSIPVPLNPLLLMFGIAVGACVLLMVIKWPKSR